MVAEGIILEGLMFTHIRVALNETSESTTDKNIVGMIDIQKIIRKCNFYYEHLKKYCQCCYAYRFCGTCLFQLNKEEVDTKEFVCANFQDQKIFKNKLNRFFSFLEK
jgi:hypothetical protein